MAKTKLQALTRQAYKNKELATVYEEYQKAPSRRLPAEAEAKRGGYTLVRFNDFLSRDSITDCERRIGVQPGMLKVTVEKQPVPFELYLQYKAEQAMNDYTHPVLIPPHVPGESKRLTLYHPVYNSTEWYGPDTPRRRFTGLKVTPPFVRAIRNVEAIIDPGALPFLLAVAFEGEDPSGTPRYLRFMPSYRPIEVRAHAAYDANLLENGSMERWDPETGLPAGTHMAEVETQQVAKDTAHVADGTVAVRVAWRGAVPPLLERFAWSYENPEPGFYEVFLRAKNPGGLPLAFETAVVVEDPPGSGRPAKARKLGRAAIPRSSAYGRVAFRFYVPDFPGHVSLLVYPLVPEGTEGAAWFDALRLVALPEGRRDIFP